MGDSRISGISFRGCNDSASYGDSTCCLLGIVLDGAWLVKPYRHNCSPHTHAVVVRSHTFNISRLGKAQDALSPIQEAHYRFVFSWISLITEAVVPRVRPTPYRFLSSRLLLLASPNARNPREATSFHSFKSMRPIYANRPLISYVRESQAPFSTTR